MNAAQLPDRIGQYQIKRLIASGGMGSVYEAMQANPRRTVAIKVVRAGVTSPELIGRFRYETQLLARLKHPGIAQIYEAGTYDDAGREVPFFAMEYIPNAKSITEYAAEKHLDTQARLELFTQVCDAVHHGHQRGIVHRDLKPQNILVDSHGRVRIIDFGVARATDADLRQTNVRTSVGELIGSIHYMSPEQFEADPNDIDTRSDVYALGAVLYVLLTGRMPYDLVGKNIYEVAHAVREEHPPPLMTHDKSLSGEIDTVVRMALRKDREQRYQSAHGLAQDVRRFLSGEAVAARPPSMAYQVRVFARRNRAVVVSMAVAVAALVAGIVVTISLLLSVDAERERAEIASRRAVTAQQFLTDVISPVALLGYGDETTVASILDRAREKIPEAMIDDPEAEADVRYAIGKGYRNIGHYAVAERQLVEALALYRATLGVTHNKSLQLHHDLYALYEVLADHEEGLKMASALDTALTILHGPRSREVLKSRRMLVQALDATGRLPEAVEACGALKQSCREQFGRTDELTLSVEADHAWFLMELGKLDTAETLARDVHARASRGFGESHDRTRETRSVLAGIFIAQGNLEEARALYGKRRIPEAFGIQRVFQGNPDRLGDGPRLLVFFETWCPFSRNAMPDLEKQYRRFREEGIEFVGLTRINRSATDESVEQFIRDWGISFSIAKESGSAWDFFECRGTPSMRLVDDGQLLWESSWYPNTQMFEGIVRARLRRAGG